MVQNLLTYFIQKDSFDFFFFVVMKKQTVDVYILMKFVVRQNEDFAFISIINILLGDNK